VQLCDPLGPGSDRVTFAGLDGEMTGSDVARHQLIQIGVALSEEDVFAARIGWPDFEYDPEALAAIGIAREDVPIGPDAGEVDRRLVAWLRSRGVEAGTLVPVGWAVSDFDLPFVRKTLPGFSAMLHHHSVELNAVVYSLAAAKPYLGERPPFATWKRMARRIPELRVLSLRGTPPKAHDAGEDALTSLMSWIWLRQIIADPSPGAIPGDGDPSLRTDEPSRPATASWR